MFQISPTNLSFYKKYDTYINNVRAIQFSTVNRLFLLYRV